MSTKLPQSIQNLIDVFARLPGIGPKMASRLAFHLLQKSEYDISRFMDALEGIREGLQSCSICGNISENELCTICLEDNRENNLICVVEGPLDVIALEKSGSYKGMYHVLGGALSPIDGIGPDQLRINLLIKRLKDLQTTEPQIQLELILATNPSLEGEATAVYLDQLIDKLGLSATVKVSRIARGLPMGSDLEYADPTTLQRALEGRKLIN